MKDCSATIEVDICADCQKIVLLNSWRTVPLMYHLKSGYTIAILACPIHLAEFRAEVLDGTR